ncbi:MAG TPA: CsgG/HfaB family protein [Burkholderiaceae bacterium]|nr:curli production assembly/transport protein CsgG [bacterium SGD-2]HZH57394.1 CsgG/HfaB family protein [Burkholderiaceae bacterium]
MNTPRHPARNGARRPRTTRLIRSTLALSVVGVLSACAVPPSEPVQLTTAATLTPPSPSTRDLSQLPAPRGKVIAAVYGFRDQTGQYKPSPDSSFSTSVTQGAASMLIKALKDSGWFTPVERESLQELLTERRIVRAREFPENGTTGDVPPLLAASILLDGGIIAYESNLRTGGIGARFLGVGASTQYRMDQVTVNLRSIDIRTGAVLHSVSTTKTIFSYEVTPSVYKFVNYTDLLEFEAGITRNEPAQLSVKEAIEAAVIHLTIQGIKDGNWRLRNEADWNSPLIQRYLAAAEGETVNVVQTPGTAARAPALAPDPGEGSTRIES